MDKPHWFMEHEADDKEQFGAIHSTLALIKDNHLAHIQLAQETQAADIRWIKWLVTATVTGIGGLLVLLIVGLLLKI